VIGVLATSLIIAALVCAAWSLGLVLRNRAPGAATLGLLALLELGLLVQVVTGIVNFATTDRQVSGGSFIGYLVGSLLIIPVAAFWALAERTRWGTTVLIVGCLVVPVMIVRMNQIWGASGG
jgi:4-amino-4-deoxy-L-arabinose transferase-like glycosyltransferase